MNRFTMTVFAGLFLLLLVLPGALAVRPTRLNITMTETVDQNVSFAKFFYLNETGEYCTITGIINVSNPSTDTVSDIYLNYTHTANMDSNMLHMYGRTGNQIVGTANGTDQPFVLHIPELRATESSVFNYTLDCATVLPPLNIETTYTNLDHGFNRKVLAGENWTITQRAIHQLAITEPITNIYLTIMAQGVDWNGTSDYFGLSELEPSGDYTNVSGNGTSTTTWLWNVGGGSLGVGAEANISYIVSAPNNVPTSGQYLAIVEKLNYTVYYLASNLTLIDVTAKSEAEFNVEKRIVQPSDNANNTNVTWEANADVGTSLNISYTLDQVTLWVTETLDPSNVSTFGGQYLEKNYTLGIGINDTSTWSTNPGWKFNFTDGSDNVNARPPIVWIRPYFNILNADNQIINTTITQHGNDYYMKYIYVINGYWLQIDKNVTSIGQDMYAIDILVENIGNAWTPQGLVVTAYDFVPLEFAPWNWSTGFDSNSSVTGGNFNGTAYRWTIPLKAPFNSSLGPRTASLANRTWTVHYVVNGSGEYKVGELYIVGLDPRQVDGASSHEGITVFSNLATRSTEIFYLGVVLFLIVLNIVNFMYTRRIDGKLK